MLLMDMMRKEILACVFTKRDWREEDGMLIMEERKLAPDWASLDNPRIIIEDGDRREVTLTVRLYSTAELISKEGHPLQLVDEIP